VKKYPDRRKAKAAIYKEVEKIFCHGNCSAAGTTHTCFLIIFYRGRYNVILLCVAE